MVKVDVIETHRESITLALCQRDYWLMAEHHPEILSKIEDALKDGVTIKQIKRWAIETLIEDQLITRVVNAARFIQKG